MAQCKASIRGGERCQNDAERGYSFCEEHKTRPNAVKERQEATVTSIVDGTPVIDAVIKAPENGYKPESAEGKALIPREGQNIFEKTTAALERAIDWEEKTWSKVAQLGDNWRYEDKNGMEQMRSEVGVHERAMDRVIRATTAMAKLNVEAQSTAVNKMVKETIKGVIIRVFKRMDMTPDQIDMARTLLEEEFAKVSQESQAS